MDIRKLQRAIVDGLEDVKAQNIVVFNTEHLSPLFERVVIASGTSNRQTKALAASVRDSVKSKGMQVMRTEGEDNGEWIIVDCGAAVVHVMQPAIRDYYHLEEIWGEKPVKLKLDGATARKLPKAEEPQDDAPAPASTSRKTAAKKVAAKKTADKKAVAKKAPAGKAPSAKKVSAPAETAAPAAKKSPARKAVVRKVPARTAATSSAGGSVAAKPTVKKPAAKSAAGKSTPAKKAAAKKAPARKAAARRSTAS